MKYTDKINEAIEVTSTLHVSQFRKGKGNLPYVSHPFSVMCIASQFTEKEDILIACLLHDILEDVEIPMKEKEDLILRKFGKNVLRIVRDVSEDKDPFKKQKNKDWKTRKIDYLNKCKLIKQDSLIVSISDKIHNLKSSVKGFKEKDKTFFDNFNATKEEQIWFYDEFYKVFNSLNILIEPKKVFSKELKIFKKICKDS